MMTRAARTFPRPRLGPRLAVPAGWLWVALILASCADRTPDPTRPASAYVVFFTATRAADHAALRSVQVPVALGGEARVTIAAATPGENQPALSEFVVRLKSLKQPGLYELVTRATFREVARNRKGKLKLNQRYIGALVPTHPGETQVVSAEGDPIHLEARLERR